MQRFFSQATAFILSGTLGLGLIGCSSKDKHDSDHADHGDSKEVVISEKDVPAEVMSGVNKTFAGAKIGKVEKETYTDGTVHYEFDLKLPDGKMQEAEFNDKGELLPEH
ncbi:MAG TPA: hypothetical protein VF624_08155 [Tepidisphaeraceae bacterium]|jgi:uncharacterized membrane protein YkoI